MDFSKIKLFVDLDGTAAVWNAAGEYEDLFKEGYFLNLRPHESVVEGVKKLYECGLDVYVLSAYLTESRFALKEKNIWVNRHLPFVDRRNRLFVPQNMSKPGYVAALIGEPDETYVLLDDYSKNLHEWQAANGFGIKLMNGLNGTVGTWKGPMVSRFDTAEQIKKGVLNYIINNFGGKDCFWRIGIERK